MSRHSGHAAGKDLAGLGGELLEKVGILEVDRIGGDVEATAWHGAVGLTEIAATLWGLGCTHGEKRVLKRPLLGLAVEGVALEVRIVLLLLEAARGIEALLVTGRDVAGDGLAFGNRFGALEDDDVAWHKGTGCVSVMGF